MMTLSKYVPSLERLKNYQFGECLLEDNSFFSLVTGNLADLDGSYGMADGGWRFLIMRFGAAEVASKLETAQGRKSRFHTPYPHKDFLRHDPSRLWEGLFQDLQQFVCKTNFHTRAKFEAPLVPDHTNHEMKYRYKYGGLIILRHHEVKIELIKIGTAALAPPPVQEIPLRTNL
jgi:hypothetical protein